MADDKDSLPKLKDLAFLKNQLERLQQRVEDEVNSGVGQVKKGVPAAYLHHPTTLRLYYPICF